MLFRSLEAIVREEARKAELAYADWNVEENKRGEENWRKNGGELVTLPPAEAKRYLEIVDPISKQILSATPKLKEDHEALLAAAAKHRR